MTNPIAYSYIRFSTPAQAKGDSLRRQLEGSEAYAAEHGLALDTSYRDEGLSGFTGLNRIKGALGNFLGKVESGVIPAGSVLIVENLDRLSREEIVDALTLFLRVISAGITVVTLMDKQTYSRETVNANPMLLLISITILARGNEESKTKAMRLAVKWAHKRTTLDTRKLTSVGPFWLELPGHTAAQRLSADWRLIPDRVAVVERIFALSIDGIGKENIARILNEEGVPSPKGRDGWHPSTIHMILRDRRTIGEFQPMTKAGGKKRGPDGPAIAHYFPPAISSSMFYRAQTAIQSRLCGGGGQKGKVANIFVGLTRCECGAAMEYRDKGYQKGRYLVCSRHHRGAWCPNSNRFTYHPVESMILDWVSDVEIPDADANKATVAGFKLAGKLAEREDIARRVANLRADAENEDDAEERAAIRARITALKAALSPLNKAIHSLTGEANQGKRTPLDDRRAALRKLRTEMASMEGAELFQARARLATALKGVLDWISFDSDGDVIAVLAGGFKAYRFRNGAFVDSFDYTDQSPAAVPVRPRIPETV